MEVGTINQIQVGNRVVTYELIRKNVKNINLRIKSDLTISISANPRVNREFIERVILSKAEWIEKTLQHFEERQNAGEMELQFANVDNIRLLGKNYSIKFILSEINKVLMDENNCIYIYATDIDDKDMLRKIWNKWFEAYIKDTLYQIVYEIQPLFVQYNIPMPVIKLRSMKTRWGSCTYNKGIITLNKRLIHMPVECIEYVAAHELTHFIQPNHSKDFYNILHTMMPDYKERKRLLEKQNLI